MKCLNRNKTAFEYLPYLGVTETLTEDDEHTGEYEPEYGAPVSYMGNISSPSGSVNQTFYGQDIRYTHILVMDDPNVNILEGGVVRWKGERYDVRAVRPTLNAVSIALRRQTNDHAEGDD